MQGCVSTRDPFPTVPRRLSLPSDVPNLARARSPPTDPRPSPPSRLRSHPDILSGGISYDNKFNVSSKVSGQNVKADVVFKGKDATGSATASYAIDKDFTADLTLNEKGDVKTVLAHAGHWRVACGWAKQAWVRKHGDHLEGIQDPCFDAILFNRARDHEAAA